MLTIRPFQSTESDYAALVEINNITWQEHPTTLEEEKRIDTTRNLKHYFYRAVAEQNSQIIGIGECGATHWLDEPDQYFWHINIRPDYAAQGGDVQLHDHLIEQLMQQNPRKFYVGMRNDKTEQIKFIEDRGYQLIQVEQFSTLDMQDFNGAAFDALMTNMENLGIQIMTVSQLLKIDPDAIVKLWNLRWEIRQDVPRAGQVTRETLEEFKRRMDDPDDRNPDTQYIAVAKDTMRYIGSTRFTLDKTDPTIAHTHLTGVLREFRRKGVATALKVHAIADAKQRSILKMNTMNNAINPMLDINKKLGFKPGPKWQYYEKIVQKRT